MGRVGLALGLLAAFCSALCVDAALDMAANVGGEKADSPFLIAQMLLWRKAVVAPASPPKAERLPIPDQSLQKQPEEQQQPQEEPQQQPQEEPQQAQPAVYDDAVQGQQPSAPDYYDAREEDLRMREAAAAAESAQQHRTHGALTFIPADHPEHVESTFEPKSMFVDPATSGDRVVAALAPNGQGRFIPLDEVVDSAKPTEAHGDSSRVVRFSDAPATGVFFVVDGDSGAPSSGSIVPIIQIPTFHVAENDKVRPIVVNGDTNVPPEQISHQIEVERPFQLSQQPEPLINTSDYEDQMREKAMAEAKYLQQKRTKPVYNAIPSQEPIEVVKSSDVVDSNPKEVIDPHVWSAIRFDTVRTLPPSVVNTEGLPSAFSDEEPPAEDQPADSTPKSSVLDSEVPMTKAHKVIDGETSASATDLPRPMIASRFFRVQ